MEDLTFFERILEGIFYLLFTIPGICVTIILVALVMAIFGADADLIARVERVVVPVLLVSFFIAVAADGKDYKQRNPSNH